MPSIRELRDQKLRERFTGRAAELAAFRRLIEAAEPEHAVLHLYGVGGVGKSSLLRQLRRVAQEAGQAVALVDMQVHFGVVEILRSLREQLGAAGAEAFADFDRSIELYNDVKSKLQQAVGSVASGVISGLREGVPLGLGALAVDAIGEEQVKAWLYRHLPRANAELYLHGDRLLTGKLVGALNDVVGEGGSRVVIMIDTYEQASPAQDAWLRDSLLDSELSSGALLVLAGRDPLGGRWHEWRAVLLARELQPFTVEEARAYLERRGIDDAGAVTTLLALTGRLPWALALATDTPAAADAGPSAPAGVNPHALGDQLVERFLSQVREDGAMCELVDACAVVRTFDDDVVRALWRSDDTAAALDRLRRFSFVLVRPDGRWSLNQTVREFLDSRLRRRSPEHWIELNRRAAAYYAARTEQWPRYSREWSWVTLEDLYHRLRLDEEQGMARLAALFEEARHVYRYDFGSELVSNVQDVPLAQPASAHWLTFYRGVLAATGAGDAWEQLRALCEELYGQPDLPRALRARLTTDLGRYCYQVGGDAARAVALLEESLALRRDLADRPGEAHVLSHLAVACSAVGKLDRGRACAAECIRLAEELGTPYRLGWGHFSLGVVETLAHNAPLAADHLRRALELFERGGHEYEVGIVCYHLGRATAATGDVPAALVHHELGLRLMQQYDKPALAVRAMVDICELLLRRDDTRRLPAELVAAERAVLQQGNHAQRARLRLIQAEVALRGTSPDAETARAAAPLLGDALQAASLAPGAALATTTAQIEARLKRLAGEGRPALARLVSEGAAAARAALSSEPTAAGEALAATPR